jgi:hypothetical protein
MIDDAANLNRALQILGPVMSRLEFLPPLEYCKIFTWSKYNTKFIAES